jgi:AcrR family transcriptional regulator
MDEVARRAGVALKTVYLAVPSKLQLLGEVIGVTLAGDDLAQPIRARSWSQETLVAPAHQLLELFAANTAHLMARAARVLQMAEAAADSNPSIRRRRDEARRARRAEIRLVAEALASEAPGIEVEKAADIMYALAAPQTYVQLVDECGWTPAQYVAWLTETLGAILLKS